LPKDFPNCRINISKQDNGDRADGDEINLIEENHDTNIIENDKMNQLIHETFAPMDDHIDHVIIYL